MAQGMQSGGGQMPSQGGQGGGQMPSQGQDQGQGGEPPSIDQMVISLDQGLTQLTQLIGQADPEAGEALAQINEQYRQVIESVIAKAQGGGQAEPQGAQAPVDAQSGLRGQATQF